ncbi:MAG TPA: efflux RND transporter permease subunit [Planctomycetaceae bacterium]|nr:efflux RND transporter permease subunit [Planctomycetaceae bacterium]
MNGLIRASLKNPYAVIVVMFTILIVGILCLRIIPIDILPVFRSPAVQVLTFYSGMPATSVEKDITNRLERWTGQANNMSRQESRSIVGASIVRNYFQGDADPNGALGQVMSLSTGTLPYLPPGTLPPVVLPFDPTATVPACIVALDSKTQNESTLYDVGRYEVRNMVMAIPGAVAPVVFGGKVRTVLAYLDRQKMQARHLSLTDVMEAIDRYNLFMPTGDAKFGDLDFAIDSNSMYNVISEMKGIPLRVGPGTAMFLGDIGTPTDTSFIQTNVVRVNGRRQVYIPVFRQVGSSTLSVVDELKAEAPTIEPRLTRPDVNLRVVMDQSIYVRQSIKALVQEGVLGAILCSLVIVIFLGELRMTAIAICTIPLSVLGAIVGLYATGNTVNVMTLAGLAMAIGPLVDSAIICLENTHRHLALGSKVRRAAFLGASEVAMPELVSSLCTFLVLAPLALMPGMGAFLFRPMAYAVAFAMIVAYVLSRSFVPSMSSLLLKSHEEEEGRRPGAIARAFARWEALIDRAIAAYVRSLDFVLRHRRATVGVAIGLLVLSLALVGPVIRRDFFPEVDAGAFEIYVRAQSGTRIERTEAKIAGVEQEIRKLLGKDLQTIISEIGVVADWSAAYTPNAGPMDAVMKVQLEAERGRSAQEYVEILRRELNHDFPELEFAFDAGGMIRGAMNEGKSTPLNIRVRGKDMVKTREVAAAIKREVVKIPGVVDARIIQRLDYPEYMLDVDRTKAGELGLSQADVMQNVVAAINSSISFNKKNFWIDPVSHNQYYVGVQYPEGDIESIETLLNIPITSPTQSEPVPLQNIASISRTTVPAEVNHTTLQPTIDLTMGVYGRDLGHVADDVGRLLKQFGEPSGRGVWAPYEIGAPNHRLLAGGELELTGEYSRMQNTFYYLGGGLILAALLMYFLMVALDRSWVVPLTVMGTVPIALAGVLPMLYFTGSALNVQSLLGIIFIVGIKVANTVLMSDFAQELRRQEGLSPTEAIRKAASIRVRPVTMTAVAAFFAMVPLALALERGSEANAPLARAILGGLIAGEPATLFVLPCLYSLFVKPVPLLPDRLDEELVLAPHAAS